MAINRIVGKRGKNPKFKNVIGGTGVSVTGLEDIQKNLRREIGNIRGDARKGLQLALNWLKGRIVKVTPIEFGILRNSIFLSTAIEAGKVVGARIGFTINYAPFVHEKTDANFSAPNTGAKFLEKPIMENSDRILQIIRDEAKIK